MNVFKTFLRRAALFLILTVLTQVGGVLYLLYQLIRWQISQRVPDKWHALGYRLLAFAAVYTAGSLLLVPPLARLNGRVPLPVFSEAALKPANYFFVIANRHYVKSALLEATLDVANQMNTSVTLFYLDANFPFFDGFPLLPHRSHDNGGKLDLAFIYENPATGKLLRGSPSWLGYGYLEAPKAGEYDQPANCEGRGYWQYSLLSRFAQQDKSLDFSASLNRQLLLRLAQHPAIGKIFLEPHLKTRLRLQGQGKIRFHGCAAVRHDDHIHIQL
ncbi:MAG: hypothetical protein RIC19_22525 [Phaeodactylibacter sp.]|uniref:hypothetical protein n=1 Tax=Phaeodactylibacter sp. TaxID=1940289 RepID=UPI0032EE3355